MKKQLLTLAVAAGLLATTGAAQAQLKTKWFGFAQVTAETRDDQKPNDSTKFGADRVRIGFKIKDGNVFGKLQVDFNKNDAGTQEGALTEIIKDVEVGYKFNKAAKVKMGQFKTPLGMDFNLSGKKLDITKRGMEKALVLERTVGLMLSGRKILGGIGYDIFYGNPAGRGKASVTRRTSKQPDLGFLAGPGDTIKVPVAGAETGSDNTTVVRVMYDMGEMMHMELAVGKESGAGVVTSDYVGGAPFTTKVEDYEVTDFGFKFKSGPMTVKGEWIDGQNVRGVDGNDETVYFIHYGHQLGKKIEAIVRFYSAEQETLAGGTDNRDLQNTFIGANFFLGSNRTNGRLQVNYVIVGGDDINSTTTYNGVSKGYTDDALITQYQMSF